MAAHIRCVVAFTFVCVSVHTAMAQDASDSGAAAVPVFQTEVIVTAERGRDERQRLSIPTALLTRERIEQSPGVTLAESIELLPGFQMLFASGSGFRPTAISRGFFGGGEAEYITLLVDGIPVNDAESGLADWRLIPSFMIDRVEAVRGPASALYGDTSLGGVVQVFTRSSDRRRARVVADAGSFSHGFLGAGYQHPLRGVSIDATGSYATSNGFRAHSALREGAAAVAVRRVGSSRQWSLRSAVDYVHRDEPGALTAPQLSASRKDSDDLFRHDRDQRYAVNGAGRYAVAGDVGSVSVSSHASTRSGQRLRTLLFAPGLADHAHRDIAAHTWGGHVETSLVTRLAGMAGELRSGLDATRYRIDTVYRTADRSGVIGDEAARFAGNRLHVGGYASQSMEVHTRLRIDAGLRWDSIDDAGLGGDTSHIAWSPKAGATVLLGAPDRQLAVFAHASRAFKAATLDQLFDPRPFPDFQGGTFQISNPSLRPQRATSIEGGIRQSARMYRWEAVYYRMRMRDEIDFDPATFTYANIGRSTHAGAELDAAIRIGAFASAGVSYAWTRVAPDTAGGDTQLKNIPRHLLRPHVTVTLPRGITAHARYVRTTGAFADDANDVPLRDRATLDTRLAKRFARTTLRVDLMNLTNDRYEEVGYVLSDFSGRPVPFYYPAPGFAARAGVEFTF